MELNIDELLGEVKPAIVFKVAGEDYPVYRFQDMTIETTARVTKANHQMQAVSLEVDDALNEINSQLTPLIEVDEEGNVIISDEKRYNELVSRQSEVQTRILPAMQSYLEASAGMQAGALSSYPRRVIEAMIQAMNEALAPKPEAVAAPQTENAIAPTTSET